MDSELKAKLQDFYSKNTGQCKGVGNWLAINNKSFRLIDALACIYEFANGNSSVMKDIIKHINDSKKLKKGTRGRGNTAYGNEIKHKIDIVRDADGKLVLQGYFPDKELQLKGQHHHDNPKIFKNDGTINKNYHRSEEKLYDLGSLVRNLYPNEDNIFITHAMQAIKNYANNVIKKSPEKVIRQIRLGRLYYDPSDEQIKPKNNMKTESVNNNRVIVITESMARLLNEQMEMTEYKFQNAVKKFLHDLLVDPVNAKLPDIFVYRGYNRSRMVQLLKMNGMLQKDERIVDKDENGNDRSASMQVKYKIPKKNFDRKLRNLYIKMFERNVPTDNSNTNISEDGCGAMGGTTSADSSGQFSEPVFPMQRRTMYNDHKEIEEDTTTSSVGNYQYDVPFAGDKETLSRNNGIGGSTSMNRIH